MAAYVNDSSQQDVASEHGNVSSKPANVTWDQYMMAIAKVVATRSPDPATKHGCVIVDKDQRIVSTGYNGPPSGCVDSVFQAALRKRPDKYMYMLHAEENAILWARRGLEGCTLYVTGEPCLRCWRMILQIKITKVVIGDTKCFTTMTPEEEEALRHMRWARQLTVSHC